MKILMADDEPSALAVLGRAVLEAVPDAETRSFLVAAEALEEIRGRGFRPDVAFIDIRMPGVSGLEMAKDIRELSPRTNIIFVTAFSDYAMDALELHPSGYIMKPATREKICVELQNLRFPQEEGKRHRIRVQCFGNFEAFAGDRPLRFEFSHSKEILAYLVDRQGASVNTGELCSVLWDDDSNSRKSQLRKYISDLNHTLESAGGGDVFIKSRNSFAVSTAAIDCDYYRFLRGEVPAVNTYNGEYMAQYSWAEMTLGSLENRRG